MSDESTSTPPETEDARIDFERGRKYSLGVEGELTYIFGAKAGAALSFDAENYELGGGIWIAGTAGYSAGISVPVSAEASDGQPAENDIKFDGGLVGDLSFGPVSVGTRFLDVQDGKLVVPSGQNESAGIDLSGGAGEIKLKPSMKVGVSVGMLVGTEATTSIVADAVEYMDAKFDEAKDVASNAAEKAWDSASDFAQDKIDDAIETLNDFNQRFNKLFSTSEPDKDLENNNVCKVE